MKTMIRLVCAMMLLAVITVGLRAAEVEVDTQRISRLEGRVFRIEKRAKAAGGAGAALILFGAFCALWAQNEGRNAWLWFFLGLFFSVITVLFLLAKNSEDIDRRQIDAGT